MMLSHDVPAGCPAQTPCRSRIRLRWASHEWGSSSSVATLHREFGRVVGYGQCARIVQVDTLGPDTGGDGRDPVLERFNGLQLDAGAKSNRHDRHPGFVVELRQVADTALEEHTRAGVVE